MFLYYTTRTQYEGGGGAERGIQCTCATCSIAEVNVISVHVP